MADYFRNPDDWRGGFVKSIIVFIYTNIHRLQSSMIVSNLSPLSFIHRVLHNLQKNGDHCTILRYNCWEINFVFVKNVYAFFQHFFFSNDGEIKFLNFKVNSGLKQMG